MPVTCSRCGAENPAAARFCMSCGNPLPGEAPTALVEHGAGEEQEPSGAPAAAEAIPGPTDPPTAEAGVGADRAAPRPASASPSSLPPQFRSLRTAATSVKPSDPEWRMSPAGPLPDPPKRRLWVWVLVAVGAVLLLCVVLTLLGSIVGDPNLQSPAGQ